MRIFKRQKKKLKKVAVIGAGFSGICAAAVLAQKGCNVTVIEKNAQLGGRARQISANGFLFDMGPSWYWMPDVFEKFFNRFGYSAADFYTLKKLNPGFQVIFNGEETLSIPESWDELVQLFESVEKGAADKLIKFMAEAEYKYRVGINDLVYQPGLSIKELLRLDLAKGIFRLQVFSSFSRHVRKYFKNEKLISIMEFPVLFLGAMPKNTPALYSLMNYAGLKQGTFYPMGGFKKVIDGMVKVAEEKGVVFKTESNVSKIIPANGKGFNITEGSNAHHFDGVISSADYNHTEQQLLAPELRNYSQSYWETKTFAPSGLIFYLGVKGSVSKLQHHNLFFDADFNLHATEIYETKKWPANPLFYVCCPSKTDVEVAPHGHENIFILMPIATAIEDTDELRKKYFEIIINRLKKFTDFNFNDNIVYKQSYCISNFIDDYNAYKGNAYGLANTLRQTANLKPSIKNKKLKNFFYAGQLTVPGPGVPPSIISGQVAAEQLLKSFNKN